MRAPSPLLLVRRFRRRRGERGAALFVVAVTLALLAAMGVYGLTATSLDVRAAGHSREAMSGQNVAVHGFMLTAETFSPGAAQGIVNAMYAGTSGPLKQSTNCRTAKPYTGLREFCDPEACVSMTPTELQNIAKSINTTVIPGLPFQADSFGPGYPYKPEVRIEVTSPVMMPAPPGFQGPDANNPKMFVEATVTVFSEMKVAPTAAPEINVIGRGRLVVGPMTKPPCVRP